MVINYCYQLKKSNSSLKKSFINDEIFKPSKWWICVYSEKNEKDDGIHFLLIRTVNFCTGWMILFLTIIISWVCFCFKKPCWNYFSIFNTCSRFSWLSQYTLALALRRGNKCTTVVLVIHTKEEDRMYFFTILPSTFDRALILEL